MDEAAYFTVFRGAPMEDVLWDSITTHPPHCPKRPYQLMVHTRSPSTKASARYSFWRSASCCTALSAASISIPPSARCWTASSAPRQVHSANAPHVLTGGRHRPKMAVPDAHNSHQSHGRRGGEPPAGSVGGIVCAPLAGGSSISSAACCKGASLWLCSPPLSLSASTRSSSTSFRKVSRSPSSSRSSLSPASLAQRPLSPGGSATSPSLPMSPKKSLSTPCTSPTTRSRPDSLGLSRDSGALGCARKLLDEARDDTNQIITQLNPLRWIV